MRRSGQNPLTGFLQAVVRRLALSDGTVLDLDTVANGEVLTRSGNTIVGTSAGGSSTTRVIGFEFGDGVNVVTVATGSPIAEIAELPWNFTITKVRIIGDNAGGSAVVNINRATYSAYPTMTGICASTKPTLTTAAKAEDSTLTGWTTALLNGDVVHAIIESNSLNKKIVVELTGTIS